MRVGNWLRTARKQPKRILERDLLVAVVGLFFVILGSVITTGGVEGRGPYPSAPEPGIGNVIVWIGAILATVGVVLAIANVLIYSSKRRRKWRDTP